MKALLPENNDYLNLHILSVLAKFSRLSTDVRYFSYCVENAFSARKRVDTVSRTSLSLYKEGILTVLCFKRDLTMSVHFSDFLKLWRQKPRRLKV